jgi:hypothetical protein
LVEGTQIDDTSENREILSVLKSVRTAMQERNQDALLALISESYFEDMGTADPEDDYGYEYLRDTVIPQTMKIAGKVVVNFSVHEIQVEDQLALADIRYNSRARLDLPTGAIWDSHKEFNRLEFKREKGKWLITRGL